MTAAERFGRLCLEELEALADGDLPRWVEVHHDRQQALQDLMAAGASPQELKSAFLANRKLLAATRGSLESWGGEVAGTYRRAA